MSSDMADSMSLTLEALEMLEGDKRMEHLIKAIIVFGVGERLSLFVRRVLSDVYPKDPLGLGLALRDYLQRHDGKAEGLAGDGLAAKPMIRAALAEYAESLSASLEAGAVSAEESVRAIELAVWLYDVAGDSGHGVKPEARENLLVCCGLYLDPKAVDEYLDAMPDELAYVRDCIARGANDRDGQFRVWMMARSKNATAMAAMAGASKRKPMISLAAAQKQVMAICLEIENPNFPNLREKMKGDLDKALVVVASLMRPLEYIQWVRANLPVDILGDLG